MEIRTGHETDTITEYGSGDSYAFVGVTDTLPGIVRICEGSYDTWVTLETGETLLFSEENGFFCKGETYEEAFDDASL